MKLNTTAANVFATIAENGSVSLPEFFFGRPAAFVEKAIGAKLGQAIVVPRVRTAAPMATLPVDSQPLWAQAHTWIAKRGQPVIIHSVSALVAAGKIKLVKGQIRGNPETFVLPSSWKEGQKLPKVTGVMPSATYKKGRLESYAVSDSGAITDNRDKRADKSVSVGKAKPEAKAPEPKKAPVAKKVPAAKAK
jgi:hypothetical protein